MNNFDEYIRQGEPSQKEKAEIWRTAIGLQDVDGLKPSEYLLETARKNIEDKITIGEVQQRINAYYTQLLNRENAEIARTEEADKVSARIAEILSEKTFSFTPIEYIEIHSRLFTGIYEFAGKIRDYNIAKSEWILDGDTVLYVSSRRLKETLEYDFEQEKKFIYKGLTTKQIIEHLAHFVADLWQIHIFGEGNTRTTAVFLIKYLRKLGFKKVNNDLFSKHSLYFRNSLVRANYEDLHKGVYKTNKFLIKFLSNLLLCKNNELKNRTMHIHFEKEDSQTHRTTNVGEMSEKCRRNFNPAKANN
ncbi:MAG: Fic family protein [Dysgonamonadaceae bacterium]|jgi:fido (protein-threonine AMPylation protein)|nr:Fic family protein [Dysgonamonadaceae bacterium]